MITCKDLKKGFNGQEVLKGISMTVNTQEITVVIGRSGEGKSVFLKHLVGLMKPDSGSIEIDGRDIAKARGAELRAIKEQFGFVFQGGALFDSLTVFENVAFPLRHKTKVGQAEIKDRVEEILEHVGLKGHGDRYPSEISGGMAKRVAVARALVLRPPVILFDEPLTGLDPIISNTILDLIGQVHDLYKFTGVVVSHDIPQIFELAHQVAMLQDGKILFSGEPDSIYECPDERVQYFLNGGRETK
jgi:phospholipid/cholesterol/gamma-HCH transport system ATP-binding protein